MFDGACDAALKDSGLSASDGKLGVLVGTEIGTLRDFVCELREAGIRVSGMEKPGCFGGGKDYVVKTFSEQDLPSIIQQGVVKDAMSSLFGRDAANNAFAQVFGTKPSASAAIKGKTSEAAAELSGKIVMREMEVRSDRKALVGVQIGDDAKVHDLSIREWREPSAMLVSASRPDTDLTRKLCQTANKDGLNAHQAAMALLYCR